MFVWYNSHIRVDMKTLFIKSCYKKGVKIINRFLEDNGNVLSHIVFQHKFDLHICTLQYNSIVSAININISKFLLNGTYQMFT